MAKLIFRVEVDACGSEYTTRDRIKAALERIANPQREDDGVIRVCHVGIQGSDVELRDNEGNAG